MAEVSGDRLAPGERRDGRAVRIRLAGGSATESQRPVIVSSDDGAVGAAAVLAQRHLVDGEPTAVRLVSLGEDRYRLEGMGPPVAVVLGSEETGNGGTRRREVLVAGFRFLVEVEDERRAALRERATRGRSAGIAAGVLEVKAIIPGRVASVSVAPGDAVVAGQQLLVVEAMKMQNELRSPRDGTIDRVGVTPGSRIEIGDLLLVIS